MFKVNHQEFSELIKEYYKKKLALFCFGAFGIGKSQIVKETAKEIAKERGREFIEWNKISKEKKQEVYEYCEKYFTLVDIRMSEQDSSDVKGLPDFSSGKEVVDWKIPFWEKYLTLPHSDGILFLDEFNLGVPIVLSSFYKVLYDRVCGEEKINDNWLIIGAGNRENDMAFVHTIPEPLKDRGGSCELVNADVEEWVTNFAIPNKIDSRIIGYVNFKPSSLHKIDFKDNQKQTTCRGWERVSILIKGVTNWKVLGLICKSAIGEGIAHEFLAFAKIQEKLKLEDIIKNPKKIKDIKDISVKYFLVSALSERYSNKKVDFKKIMETSDVLDGIENGAPFVALLWRLCSSYTEKSKRFKKDFLNDTKFDKFKERYGKFIV